MNPVAASNVTGNGATLNGTVNPEGTDTTAYFEYGTTTSYGTTTASQDLGSGDAPVAVTAGLTGLQPNTTYYYELVTVSNGLTSTYAGQSFTTGAASVGVTGSRYADDAARGAGDARAGADGIRLPEHAAAGGVR